MDENITKTIELFSNYLNYYNDFIRLNKSMELSTVIQNLVILLYLN